MTIVPTFTDDPFDADTHADDAVAATRLGFKERDQDGLSFPGPILGTGQGSDSAIHYTPVPKGTASSGPGSLSDEILLHELVHTGRQVKGIQNFEAIHNGAQNEEEYLAIIVTNVYLSEKKQTQFRGPNHKTFDVLPQPDRFLEGRRGSSWKSCARARARCGAPSSLSMRPQPPSIRRAPGRRRERRCLSTSDAIADRCRERITKALHSCAFQAIVIAD
jgi:hypothetical protein